MNIIISQRYSKNQYGYWINSLESSYLEYFTCKYGLTVYPIPNIKQDLEAYIHVINPHGVILSGGENISPNYKALKNSINEKEIVLNTREQVETDLLNICIKRHLPVLGICRGMQMINYYFGGSVFKISEIDKKHLHITSTQHQVTIKDRNLTRGYKVKVNSYHDFGISKETLGKNLQSFAEYEELKLIEGIYHLNYSIAGIMWHPERNKTESKIDKLLINAFTNRKLYWCKN